MATSFFLMASSGMFSNNDLGPNVWLPLAKPPPCLRLPKGGSPLSPLLPPPLIQTTQSQEAAGQSHPTLAPKTILHFKDIFQESHGTQISTTSLFSS